MRSVVMRTFALVALAGQLQSLPGALACVREHRRPDQATHCQRASHDAMTSDGAQAAVQGIPDAAQSLCSLLGPCAVPTPAATQAGVIALVGGDVRQAAWATPVVPLSIDLTPQPPPPLA